MKRKVVWSILGGMLLLLLAACTTFEQDPLPTLVPVLELPDSTPTSAPDRVETVQSTPEATSETEIASEPSELLVTDAATTSVDPGGAMAYINSIGAGLFLVRPDNSAQTHYYALENVERLLSASFNGARVALISNGRLFVARTDGSGLTEITAVATPSWLTWSPVRDEFAVIDNGDLVVVQADSDSRISVASNMQLTDIPGSVAWSPDGSELLFTCGAQATDLCRVARDGGSAVINVTNNGVDSFAWYREPAWSPNGSQISYVSPDEDKNLQLYVMNVDGSGVRQLTIGAGQSSLHHWSPDGEWIAYAHFADSIWHALVVRPDGSEMVELSANLPALAAVVPQWDVAGEQVSLLYTVDAAVNNVSIALVALDGTAVTPITDNGWQLQWSPSGQQLAYIAGDAEIYVQAPNSDTPFIISCEDGCESFIWLP